MRRLFSTCAIIALLAGCDGENPFQVEESLPVDETEGVEPGDPNVTVDSRFAYDLGQRLTMNSVDLDDNGTPNDPTDDQLVINNLPFDGPDGRYLQVEVLGNGAEVYQSQQTATTGTTLTFAVFVRADHLEATSAASGQWADYGYAGANINRDSFDLPGGVGEYVYRGTYAATRTFSDRGGIEIISGDVELRLDELDFDPSGDIRGALDGVVTNRTREGAAGTLGLGDLPPIVFAVAQFNGNTGVWEGGTASTFFSDGNARSTGEHEGLIAGPNGEEMGGYSIVTGVADAQTVTYQQVTYRVTTPTGIIDPITGQEIVTVQTLTSSGRDDFNLEDLQNRINNRQSISDFYPATGVPPDAEIISDVTLEIDLTTEYDAREIGVFIGDQVPG